MSVSIGSQSPDIAQGVDDAFEYREGEGTDEFDRQGAGDQGLMFGYACRETPELMPLPITLAHRLAQQLSEVRKAGTVAYLRPDGKTQVTIEYDGDRPVRLDTVVVSTQHAPDIDLKELLAPDIREYVVDPDLADAQIDTEGYRLLVNPTGRFEIGGPMGDAGLTGPQDHRRHLRRHGAARRRRLLRQGPVQGRPLAPPTRCAGWPRTWSPPAWPTAARCRSRTRSARPSRSGCSSRRFGTEKVPVERIQDAVIKVFDLRPRAHHPRPRPAAPDLHADRGVRALRPSEPDFTWERIDRADQLRAAAGTDRIF